MPSQLRYFFYSALLATLLLPISAYAWDPTNVTAAPGTCGTGQITVSWVAPHTNEGGAVNVGDYADQVDTNFTAGQTRTIQTTITVPRPLPPGKYTVSDGVYDPSWDNPGLWSSGILKTVNVGASDNITSVDVTGVFHQADFRGGYTGNVQITFWLIADGGNSDFYAYGIKDSGSLVYAGLPNPDGSCPTAGSPNQGAPVTCSYTFSGLSAGSSHSYSVGTVYAHEATTSPYIAADPTPVFAPSACIQPDTPPPPTGVWAGPSTCGTQQINISWNASLHATSYQVYRDGTKIYDGDHLAISDYNLTAGKSYTYTVTAKNSSGTSAASGTTPPQTTAPGACNSGGGVPSTPVPTATPASCGSGEIDLSWNTSSGADSYTVYRDGAQIYHGAERTAIDTGLATRQSYAYTVTATNAAGTSVPGATTPIDTKAPSACATQPASASIFANPAQVPQAGDMTIVSWTSANALSCLITRNGAPWQSGLRNPGLSTTIAVQTIFTISCRAANGGPDATDSVTVTVGSEIQEF